MDDHLSTAQPEVPPSPLTEAQRHPEWREVRLPWTTVLTVTGACLIVGLVSVLEDAVVARAGGPPIGRIASLGSIGSRSLWSAFFWALGLVAIDRVLPRWPRPARWSLGLGLGALVPDPQFILRLLQAASVLPGHLTRTVSPGPLFPAHVTLELLPWLPFALLFGCFLGLAARRPAGILWRLPLVGTAVEVTPLLAFMLAAAVFAPQALPTDRWEVVHMWWILVEGALFGGLLGLAIAERLHAAWGARLEAR